MSLFQYTLCLQIINYLLCGSFHWRKLPETEVLLMSFWSFSKLLHYSFKLRTKHSYFINDSITESLESQQETADVMNVPLLANQVEVRLTSTLIRTNGQDTYRYCSKHKCLSNGAGSNAHTWPIFQYFVQLFLLESIQQSRLVSEAGPGAYKPVESCCPGTCQQHVQFSGSHPSKY